MPFIRPGRDISPVAAPPPAPPAGDITPSLVVEHIDTSGVLTNTTAASDGSSSITGYAPLFVHIDCTGSRSAVTDSLAKCWGAVIGTGDMGHLIDYGEGRGTTWAVSGDSRDRDDGAPVWGYGYETPGTYTLRYRCRDSAGNEGTRSMTVVVQAQTVTRTITSSTGSWGTISSGDRIVINGDLDLTSWGAPTVNGLHNVVFERSGGTNPPIISGINFDSRHYSTIVAESGRTRHVRLQGIDVADVDNGSLGPLYCGAINGRVRRHSGFGVQTFDYGAASTDAQRANLRYVRGQFFINCGEINSRSDTYVIFGKARRVHFIGCTLNRTTGSSGNGHVHRFGGEQCTFRHSICTADVADPGNGLRVSLGSLDPVTGNPYDWGCTDAVGRADGSGAYGYPASLMVFQRFQLGDSGSALFTGAIAMESENADTTQAGEYLIFEDGWSFADPMQSLNDPQATRGGRYLGIRNCRKASGSGGWFTLSSTTTRPVPAGWDGPYFYQTTSTRPVPTPF